MPSASEIYSGKYLKAETVKSKELLNKPLKISEAVVDLLGQGDNAKDKIILTLENVDKLLALNSTNASILIEAYGDDFSKWVGRTILLQVVKRRFQGQSVDGIAVSPSSINAVKA